MTIEIRSRMPLVAGAAGLSGARIERAVLGDGRHVVLKHLPTRGDWLTRATAGDGRIRLLWESGAFERVGRTVDHCMLDVIQIDGADVIVMSDVSDARLPAGTIVTLDQARRLLAGLAAMHDELSGAELDGLCPLDARLALFSPQFHASDDAPGSHPSREFIVSGWEHFVSLVPSDVADAVFAVHQHPQPLAKALAESSHPTLVHGVAKLENLGLDGSRVVAIDWGDLTGIAPAAIDVAWFAIQDGWRFDFAPDVTFAAYDEVAADPLDRLARDLACITALA